MKITNSEKNRIIKIIILSSESNDVYTDSDDIKTYDYLLDKIIKLNDLKSLSKNDICVVYSIFHNLKNKTKTDERIINKLNKIIVDKT